MHVGAYSYEMNESDVVSFLLWSLITAMLMGVTAFSYKAYLRRRNGKIPSP